jgi:hypothetical protein
MEMESFSADVADGRRWKRREEEKQRREKRKGKYRKEISDPQITHMCTY